MPEPKIVFFDIEATNLRADFGYMLCASFKQLGKDPETVAITDFPLHKRDPTNDKRVVREVVKRLVAADIIVTWYGKGFDVPYVNARAIVHNQPIVPGNINHIDLWWTARKKLKLSSNRLANVQRFLGLENKKTALDGPTWVRAQAGHRPSINYVIEHCEADVTVLEDAYMRLRSLITQHPPVSLITGVLDACPNCGSQNLQSNGWRYTAASVYRRVFCKGCGAWSRDKAREPGEVSELRG